MIVIDGYTIDAAIREEHSHPSTVTKLPIEDGSDTSDHNRIENDTFTVEGIVSDTPIGAVEALRNLDGATKPSDECRAHLLELRDRRRPITVVSSRAVYESMAMIGFTSRDSAEETGGFFFTATFEKQRISVVARVKVAVPRANAEDNLGNRPRKPYNYGQNVFVHLDGFWIDPDLTVGVKGIVGVDISESAGSGIVGSSLGLTNFEVWRKSQTYDHEVGKNTFTKAALRDGFMGTDEEIRHYVAALTPRLRKGLFPARHRMSIENEAKERAFAKSALDRVRKTDKNGPRVSPAKARP